MNTKLRIENNFFGRTEDLRAQFDERMARLPINSGMTPFFYAFGIGTYHFLTASVERVFHQESIDCLEDKIRYWATNNLGASQTSTPQIRIYVGGCRRNFARDNVEHPWHYMLGLSSIGREKLGCVRVLLKEDDGATRNKMVGELLRVNLELNQLLVHSTTYPYSIETSTLSMNPSDGLVLLDGYLW